MSSASRHSHFSFSEKWHPVEFPHSAGHLLVRPGHCNEHQAAGDHPPPRISSPDRFAGTFARAPPELGVRPCPSTRLTAKHGSRPARKNTRVCVLIFTDELAVLDTRHLPGMILQEGCRIVGTADLKRKHTAFFATSRQWPTKFGGRTQTKSVVTPHSSNVNAYHIASEKKSAARKEGSWHRRACFGSSIRS